MSAPDFGELVHRYTRRQALADGVLRDASNAARELGFRVPVAITAAVWVAIEAIPARLQGIADMRGRLHDVLWMASLAARREPSRAAVPFRVLLPTRGSRRQLCELLAVVGPDDDGAPCVTVGFPEDF